MAHLFRPEIVSLAEARTFPSWRRPEALLVLFSIAVPISFATWAALLNNFVIEVASFDGVDIGWLQTVREIPGFFAVAVIALIIFVREQILALLMLATLGGAIAVVAWFPSVPGLLLTTFVSSIGFHYFHTVNQSLQLQWLEKERAPAVLGILVAVSSGASLVAYGILVIGWKTFGWSYNAVYMVGGGATFVLAIACWFLFPQFEAPEPQNKKIILRKRYWLYYALQFIAGGRRQIFVVFAAFMMVERFGFEVHEVTGLFLLNYVVNMIVAPILGRMVGYFGERLALIFEYSGLIVIFLAYGGVYYFGWGVMVAAGLYVADHLFFALALAINTYFQKIADPADIAPSAAVALTINHIAAVFLPAVLGYLWIVHPGGVFLLAAAMAAASLGLALLIPRHPEPGNETIFSRSPVINVK